VSLDLILFLDLLKLFVNMGLVKSFAGLKNFIFFRPTNKKLWVFEVSWRSLGRAGICWSQLRRVDKICSKNGARGRTGGETKDKKGDPQGKGPRPLVAGLRPWESS
jgi:hypothetical protein